MWLVLRHKKGELSVLKEEIKKKIGRLPEFFCPKIKILKVVNNKTNEFTNNFLSDYVFFYDKQFTSKTIINSLKNSRGLKTLLSNCLNYQKDVEKFINLCKSNSDKDGYIKPSYFDNINFKKGIFLNGPFAQIIFDVLENKKNFLKVAINKKVTTLSKKTNFIYRSI